MPGMSVRVEGVRELRSALTRIDPDLRAQMKAINMSAAKVVLPAAVASVPVGETGRLRATVRALASQRAGRVAAGRKSVPYAGVIHFGWPKRHIRPQPFLWDALDRRRVQVIGVYQRRVARVVDQAMRRTK